MCVSNYFLSSGKNWYVTAYLCPQSAKVKAMCPLRVTVFHKWQGPIPRPPEWSPFRRRCLKRSHKRAVPPPHPSSSYFFVNVRHQQEEERGGGGFADIPEALGKWQLAWWSSGSGFWVEEREKKHRRAKRAIREEPSKCRFLIRRREREREREICLFFWEQPHVI